MKRSLIALAVLGGFSGMAAAQSSVTLFGIVDVAGQYIKNDGFSSVKLLQPGGLSTSRFGVRGVEDLGGGLKAGFHLESSVNADNGTASAAFWQRKSTVSLMGGFGEVRLGRDYTPTFINHVVFDPFGATGIGAYYNIAAHAGQITHFRSSNSIGYFLPSNIGGVYGQAMVAAGEGGAGKYYGARVGFAGGPFDVSVALGRQDEVPGGATKYKTAAVGGSWDFGIAKLIAQLSQEKGTLAGVSDVKERRWLVGASMPLGQGELRGSFSRSDLSTGAFSGEDADQLAVGYVYNLSKRTALYATVSHIKNDGTRASAVGGIGGPTGGGKSTGLEGGLRHSF
jgi:predicted porin